MAEVINNYTPTPMQSKAHASPVRYKLYGGAMGGGKTRWLCEEVKELSLQFPGNRIVICRYHLSDFRNSTFKTLLDVLPPEFIKHHDKTYNQITLTNGSEIIYMGLSEQTDVSKLKSMELGAFAIDEASEIPKQQFLLFQSRLRRILPNGSRPHYCGILASNPEDCWLKDDFVLGKGGKNYAYFPSLPKDNPYLPEGYVDTLRESYPEEWIRAYLEGSWDDIGSNDILIRGKDVEKCVDKTILNSERYTVAADIARFGGDEIVIQIAKGFRLIEQDITTNKDLMDTTGRIAYFRRKCKAEIVAVDSIGIGAGVCDRLAEQDEPVMRVCSAEKSDNPRYWNRRCEMWHNAAEIIRKGQCSILDDPILKRQLSSTKYKFKNMRMALESKDDVKKRLGNSPDRADTFVMLMWAASKLPVEQHDFNRNVIDIRSDARDSYGWGNYREAEGNMNPFLQNANDYGY